MVLLISDEIAIPVPRYLSRGPMKKHPFDGPFNWKIVIGPVYSS